MLERCTGWRTVIGCLISRGHFQQKKYKKNGSLHKEVCNLRHPMHFRHPVQIDSSVVLPQRCFRKHCCLRIWLTILENIQEHFPNRLGSNFATAAVFVSCKRVSRGAAGCSVLQCVAVCCSVLQCVAVCCSVLQNVAVRAFFSHAIKYLGELKVAVFCSVLQCFAECCSVLQYVGVCCSVLQRRQFSFLAIEYLRELQVAVCRSVSQYTAVCYSVLQCVTVCCSVLQCIAVYCSVL